MLSKAGCWWVGFRLGKVGAGSWTQGCGRSCGGDRGRAAGGRAAVVEVMCVGGGRAFPCLCVCRCSLVLRGHVCGVSLSEAQKLQRNNAIFGDGLVNYFLGTAPTKERYVF